MKKIQVDICRITDIQSGFSLKTCNINLNMDFHRYGTLWISPSTSTIQQSELLPKLETAPSLQIDAASHGLLSTMPQEPHLHEQAAWLAVITNACWEEWDTWPVKYTKLSAMEGGNIAGLKRKLGLLDESRTNNHNGVEQNESSWDALIRETGVSSWRSKCTGSQVTGSKGQQNWLLTGLWRSQ